MPVAELERPSNGVDALAAARRSLHAETEHPHRAAVAQIAGFLRRWSDDFPPGSPVTVLELTLLKDQVSGERTGRRRGRGPLTVRDDGVRDVRALGWLGVSVEHFFTEFVGYDICDSACV